MTEDSQLTDSASAPQRPTARLGLAFDDFRSFITHYAPHIAMGGMFVGARSPLPPGSVCQLDFKLKDGFQLIEGLGEVVWTRERAEGPERPPGMGIRFRELDDTSRDLVFHIVERRLAQGESLADVNEEGGDADLEELVRSAGERRLQAEARAAEEASMQAEPTRHLSRSAIDAALVPPISTDPEPAPALSSIDDVADDALASNDSLTSNDSAANDELLPSLPDHLEDLDGLETLRAEGSVPDAEADQSALGQSALGQSAVGKPSGPPGTAPSESTADDLAPISPFGGETRRSDSGASSSDVLNDDLDAAAAAWEPPLDTIHPGASSAGARISGGSQVSGSVDLEALFKVAPTVETSGPAATPVPRSAPRTHRSRTPLLVLLSVLLLLAVTVGVLLWWMNQPAVSAPPVRELPRNANREAPTPVDVGDGVVSEGASGEAVKDVSAAAPSAATAPPPPPPAAPARESSATPARVVDNISWRDGGGETQIIVSGDGAFPEARRSVSRLGGDSPRLLIVLKGISRPFRPPQLSVDTGQVASIRTGLHVKDTGEELHLVVDLKGGEMELLRSETADRELRLWVGSR